MIILKSRLEIEKMRDVCKIVAEVLLHVTEEAKVGVSTIKLNELAEKEVIKRKAKPAFKGYCGYPYALCCSPNEQVVHGMPNSKQLKSGDILSIDFGAYYNGFYGDAAVTIPIGTVTDKALDLINVTEESLYKAISVADTNHRVSDISHSVQEYVEDRGYSVVRDFVGHGIGRRLHESPQIPNYGEAGKGPCLRQGMVLAIEPMINESSFEVKVLGDGWTAVTCDGGLSAHFEHTVAITDNGPLVLTKI